MVSAPLELKPKRRGKFTPQDIINVCTLMAEQGHTQEAACLLLGIKPNSFAIWKCHAKNQQRFANLLAHAKAMLINGCFESGMATGAKDWRYWDKRLERIAPERFGQQQGQSQHPVVAIVSDAQLKTIADRIYGQPKTSQVVDIEEVKRVQDKQ